MDGLLELCMSIIMLTFGVPLNFLAFSKLHCRRRKPSERWRKEKPDLSALRIWQCHLNIADLLIMLLYMPSKILADLLDYEWRGGEILCRSLPFAVSMAFYLSTSFIVGIAVDRACCALSRTSTAGPLGKRRRLKLIKKLVAAAWCFSAIASVPQLLVFETGQVPLAYSKSYSNYGFEDGSMNPEIYPEIFGQGNPENHEPAHTNSTLLGWPAQQDRKANIIHRTHQLDSFESSVKSYEENSNEELLEGTDHHAQQLDPQDEHNMTMCALFWFLQRLSTNESFEHISILELVYHVTQSLLIFWLPFIIIITCYTIITFQVLYGKCKIIRRPDRSRRGSWLRVIAKNTIFARSAMLVLAYVACWAPYNFASIITSHEANETNSVVFWLYHLVVVHSALNPLIYILKPCSRLRKHSRSELRQSGATLACTASTRLLQSISGRRQKSSTYSVVCDEAEL